LDSTGQYHPPLPWRIAEGTIKIVAWLFYFVPFLAVILDAFGHLALIGGVATLPAIAYALRYLFKDDDVLEGEASSARAAINYRINEATRGTSADRQGR